ncbi:MAG: protein adenylyltransferase SelO [Hyphomicrobium sp.]
MTSPDTADIVIPFDNSYARLPDRFFVRQHPTPVSAPGLIRINDALARDLGIDPAALASPAGIAVLAGNRIAQGSAPIAAAYAGHQFGGFSPALGDGRAILLGEVIGKDGIRRDIQLKGSGPTPWSRRGDGRAALGPVLREYIVSEAFAALGIPTTRALAAVTTGDVVQRETPMPGGVLARVAASHIRVGTFQYFAARQDVDAVRILADHVIARHYPDAAAAAHPYRALLDGVVAGQASLIAQWMLVGFIHGVMNTDNCQVAGETIDFGPCAFMDAYHPDTVFSSIDRNGRYAFASQPAIAHWNLVRFAETLLPLLGDDQDSAVAAAQAALDPFAGQFEAAYGAGLRRKIGLAPTPSFVVGEDTALIRELFDLMATGHADFTLTFRRLADAAVEPAANQDSAADPAADTAFAALFSGGVDPTPWLAQWRSRLATDPVMPAERRTQMRGVNPLYIPRNHRIEQAIAAAVGQGDFGPFHTLVDVLAKPFDDQPAFANLAEPPAAHEIVQETFCGT